MNRSSRIKKSWGRVVLSLLGILPGLPALAQQPVPGFWSDAKLDLHARNVFWHQAYKTDRPDNRVWAQGLRLEFQSGDTPGLIGIGAEASVYGAFKLDATPHQAGWAGVLVPDGDGVRDTTAWAGGAIRLRAGDTVLRYGNNLRPYTPVFAPADTRLLPSTATGWWLKSKLGSALQAEAGYFTAGKDYARHRSQRSFYASYAGVSTDRVGFVGANLALGPDTGMAVYASQYTDIWRQYYLNLNHAWQVGAHRLGADFNLYRSLDQGRKRAGDINVTAWSLALSHTYGAHTLRLSHQRVMGDQPMDYLGMAPGSYHDSIYLAHPSQLSDFNGPGEKSWGIFLDTDMAAYGVPGLSLHTRYIYGTGADGSRMRADSPYAYYAQNEKHWELDVDVKYAVQTGAAKGLTARLRLGFHRMLRGTSNVSSRQVRLIFEYPYNLL